MMSGYAVWMTFLFDFQNFGKIPLAECSLVEDTSSDFFPFEEESKFKDS